MEVRKLKMSRSFESVPSNFAENYAAEYKSNFAGVEDNTCYYDPLGTSKGNKLIPSNKATAEIKSNIQDASKFAYDRRAELNMNFKSRVAEMKAMTSQTGGAGTTDYVLNPFNLDPEMWDLSRKELPARTIIRRVTNYGPLAVWNTLDGKGNSTHGDAFYNELETPNYDDSSYSRHSASIKLMRRGGTTSGFAQATQPGFTNMGFNYQVGADGKVGSFTNQAASNATDRNIIERTKALMEDEEWAIFNGDSSTNSKEFDGIIAQLGTTNTVDKNSSAVTLKDFRTAATNARQDGGYVDLGFTDLTTYDEVISLIQATKQGIVDYGDETEYGFNYVKLRVGSGTVKLIGSQFLTTTEGSRAAWLLDSRVWEMRVVQDITYQPMGRVIDGESFIVKMYEALICKAIQFNASITEITA